MAIVLRFCRQPRHPSRKKISVASDSPISLPPEKLRRLSTQVQRLVAVAGNPLVIDELLDGLETFLRAFDG